VVPQVWATIWQSTAQEYVEVCRTHGYFTPAFYATAIAHMERNDVRRRLKQIVSYHYSLAGHHLFKAQTYRDHAKMRYGLQLPLFGEDDGAV
jgi:hypothetical protein